MTSVTISDKIRKKLKELAAKFDTTQGKIIEEALKIFERKIQEIKLEEIKLEEINEDTEITEILRKESKKLRENNPKLQSRRKKLEQKGITINEIISYTWGSDFEDIS